MNFKTMTEIQWGGGRSTLALVFRDRSVDAVWLEQSLLGPSLRLLERFPLDGRMEETLALRIQESGKTPACVRVCLPRSLVMQRTLTYPAAVKNDLPQMLQFEAVRHVPLPETDRRIAFSSVDLPGGDRVGVNLLAARSSDIETFLDPLKSAGIPVDEVLVFSSLPIPGENPVPALQVLAGEDRIELALFANGLLQESLLLDRRTPGFSGESLTDAAHSMAVRHRDLLGAEGIGRIVCYGAELLPDEMQDRLGVVFGLHVRTPEIPDRLRMLVSHAGTEVPVEALFAAAADLPPGLNLIEPSGRTIPLSRRTLTLAALCALLAAELLIGGLIHLFAPGSALKKLEKENAELRRRAAPVLTIRNQNRDDRSELEQLDRLVQTRTSAMHLLKTLSDTLPEDTYLLSAEYVRGDELRIRGRSKNPERLPQTVLDIPFVQTIEESTIGEKEGDYFGFRLSAALQEYTR